MKKIKYILSALTLLGLASCSVEAPFKGAENKGTGELSKYAFDLDVSVMNNTRAATDDVINDFNIVIQKMGSTPVTMLSSLYKDMPEIVTLEAGSYIAYATYGENQDAEFEKPYYLGQSKQFEIQPSKITTDIGTIECKLENVKVTIDFHSSLYNLMDDDAYVEVYVNPDSSLKFYKDEKRAGYFKHSDVCTLTATFHGMIDDVMLHEVKTLSDVNKGNHYNLTFSKHTYSADSDEGSVNGDISVSASVTIVNVNENITIADDEILDDSERPSEDDPSIGEDPGKDPSEPDDPEDPEQPGEDKKGLQLYLDDSSTVVLEKQCEVTEESVIILKVHSDEGIETFKVNIISDELTDMIPGNGVLDLVEPGETLAFLNGFEILPNGKTTVKGDNDVVFDITGFMSMLLMVPGEHTFRVTVGDATGDKTVNLILFVPDPDND